MFHKENGKKMNEIIEELLKKGINTILEYDKGTNKNVYYLDGFYKSGTVKLMEECDGLYALQRYGDRDKIESFRDLVHLNFVWWNRSKEHFDGWAKPDPKWLPFLIEEGFIEEKVETVVTYKPKSY
jgi:hypothetical protein